MNNYEVHVYNPQRTNLLAILTNFASLDYVLNENAPGAMTLVIPPEVPRSYFTADTQLEIWRTAGNGAPYLEGECQWFVERVTNQYTAEELITIQAVDGMSLLGRREVLFYAGYPGQSDMSGPADDLMKEVMRQNFPSTTPVIGRITEGYFNTEIYLGSLFSIQGNSSNLPSIKKAFSWQNVLTVLQSMADVSFAAGTYGGFRMVQVNPDTGEIQFRTFAGASGPDRRAVLNGEGQLTGVILTPENGSVVDASIVEDWSNTATNVIAGGQGEYEARQIGKAIMRAPSAWGYREKFVEQTNTGNVAILNDYAAGKLQEFQPKRQIIGTINETSNIRYGVDFGLGFWVTADVGGFVLDCRVKQVHITVTQEAGEVITSSIFNESAIVQ